MENKITTCEQCEDTLRVRVLDIWTISRTIKETGFMPSFDGFKSFPMVPGGAPCPNCVGVDEFDEAIDKMNKEWGNPYSDDN